MRGNKNKCMKANNPRKQAAKEEKRRKHWAAVEMVRIATKNVELKWAEEMRQKKDHSKEETNREI
jgi:hypothetical protein